MSSRERILDAASTVMGEQGLARATTKLIAREAGLSEAMLYRHFADKNELFIRVLHERLPPLGSSLAKLGGQVGRGSLRRNLEEVCEAALGFYLAAFPLTVSIFADAPLLGTFKEWATEHGVGPHKPVMMLAEYLTAEQAAGRISRQADCDAAAALLLGACFQHALLVHFTDDPPAGVSRARAAERLVSQLCASLPAEGG